MLMAGCQELNSSTDNTVTIQPTTHRQGQWQWWLTIALNITLLVVGQAAGVLLGRLYYVEGGNSIWMATLVQSAGFPVLLLPLLFTYSIKIASRSPTSASSNKKNTTVTTAAAASAYVRSKSPSVATLTFIYVGLGLLMAGDNVMYSYGLLYLPVSTYSLICATQLAFNALFSFFFNSQKFTYLIFNSAILLTFSAALLAVRSDSMGPTGVSTSKHVLGFIFTVGASAGYALWLSLAQLSFQKVLKKETVSVVFRMQIYTMVVATSACVVGLYASGESRNLQGEMKGYHKGRVSYVMTLVWTAVAWQVSSIGTLGLIFQVSSLFTNVISTFALPIVPILGMIFFHDKMDGVKVISLLLAIWGFLSYIYQHYVDDSKSKAPRGNANEDSLAVV